jgi:hypothetical protein
MFSDLSLGRFETDRNRIFAIFFVIGMFALPGLVLTSAAATGTTKITLSPVKFKVGGTVEVTGANFAADSPITLTIGGNALPQSSTTSNSAGGFDTSFVVPTLPAGAYNVSATDGTHTANKTFTVVPSLTTIRTTIQPGYVAEISGAGFAANSRIRLTLGGASLGTTTSTSQGTFTFPSTAYTPGKYMLTATDGSGNSKSIEVTVKS